MCRVIVMGACPHDDHAQSSNWGIFNQHIWGDYNQHSHCCPVPAARPASPGCGNCSRSYPHQRQKSRKPNRPRHRRAHAVVVRWSSSRSFPDGVSPEDHHGRLIRPGDHHDSPQRPQHDQSRCRSGSAPANRGSCTHHWKTRENRCLHCQFCHRVMQIRSQKPVPVPQTHLYALAQPLPRVAPVANSP